VGVAVAIQRPSRMAASSSRLAAAASDGMALHGTRASGPSP
jgi:hypothetical protein